MKTFFQKLRLLLIALLILSLLGACVPGQSSTTEAPETESSEIAESTNDSSETESAELTEEPTTEEPTEEATAPDGSPLAYRLKEGSPLKPLPYYSYDTFFDYWDMENSAEMLLFTAENGDGHAQYLNELAAAGFTLYAENEIVGNLYSTWVGKDTHVTVMYMPSLSSVRIVAEPSSIDLPGLASENVYTDGGYENIIFQIGTFYDTSQNGGMCYVYRLCDGSFIVVDLGFRDKQCADNLYEILAEYTPDPDNIVIAAFFLTHPHKDHVGGFYEFVSRYSDKVTVEQVIYNYPTRKVFQLSTDKVSHLAETPKYIERLGDCKVIEAHPGQEFFIRDAYIEMLYTWEQFDSPNIANMNNTSLVFSVTLSDTKVMQLGDCGPMASPKVVALYGDYLDSDVIQVAHHGNKGATKELNLAINAEVILYPASEYNYELFFNEDRNSPFKDAKYVYVAHTRATMIPLPFNPETVEIWEIFE